MNTAPYPSSFPGTPRPTIDPDYADAARDLAQAYIDARAALTAISAHLEDVRQQPHTETCDADTGCTRDLTDEIHALLPRTT